MNPSIIASILAAILHSLPQDIVKEGLDYLLDKLEDLCAKSSNKWDDTVIIPLIAALRAQLGITEEPGSKYADNDANVNVTVTVKDQTK